MLERLCKHFLHSVVGCWMLEEKKKHTKSFCVHHRKFHSSLYYEIVCVCLCEVGFGWSHRICDVEQSELSVSGDGQIARDAIL